MRYQAGDFEASSSCFNWLKPDAQASPCYLLGIPPTASGLSRLLKN
jgi:hypothetical protein